MGGQSRKYHQGLASYYQSKPLYLDEPTQKKPNTRKLVEQPWQQIRASMFEELKQTLCDIFFIEARAKADMLDIQQSEFEESLSLISDPESQKCLNDFNTVFMQQKHVIKEYPEISFQHLYNELQWKKGPAKSLIDGAKKSFLSKGKSFWHQYRIPQISESNLIMTLTGHTSPIICCAYSPDGKRIASGQTKEEIFDYVESINLIIWNAETGKKLHQLKWRSRGVLCCAFSPDGNRIVIGEHYHRTSQDYKYFMDKIDKSNPYIDPHLKEMYAYEESLKYRDNFVLQVWDLDTLREVFTTKGHSGKITHCTFSPDGKYILSCSYDHSLKIWDADTGLEIAVLKGHTGEVNTCSFSPDGTRIVSGSSDKTLKLWDVGTYKEINTIQNESDVKSCSFSPDGKWIIDNCRNIWDGKAGISISTLLKFVTSDEIDSHTLLPDNWRIVLRQEYFSDSIGYALNIYDVKTKEIIFNFKGHTSLVTSSAFSPDGKRLVTGSLDKTLKIWNVDKNTEIMALDENGYLEYSQFSKDGKRIVTKDKENSLKIWDADTGMEFTIPDYPETPNRNYYFNVSSFAMSPNGKLIVDQVRVWEVETSKDISTLPRHIEYANSYLFSPDGTRIIASSRAYHKKWGRLFNSIGFARFEYANLKICYWDANTGRKIFTYNLKKEQPAKVESFSPDGRLIFLSGYDYSLGSDGSLKLLDLNKCLKTHYLKVLSAKIKGGDKQTFFDVSPDSKKIISNNNKTITIWDANTLKEINILNGHQEEVTSCSFSPDGKQIVSGSKDGTIKIWEMNTGSELATFKGHNGIISKCIYLPNGKLIVSAGEDGTLKLWNLKTLRETNIFVCGTIVKHFVISACGTKIAFTDKAQNFYLIELLGLDLDVPIVTGLKLFISSIRFLGIRIGSRRDKNVFAICPYCGNRFPYSLPINTTWDDVRLVSECPGCKKKLKFNPFIAGDYKPKPKWNFWKR